MNNLLKRKEIIGVFVVFLLGFLMHFLYEWSDHSTFIGLFAPINESVWEHLKLVLWPTIIYSLYEYFSIKDHKTNFTTAKLASILIAIATILIIFYSYTSITGHSILFIDILSFLIGISLGQLFSYKIMTEKELPNWLNVLSLILIIALIAIFIVFTFSPPELPPFQDPTNGNYGI